MNETFLKFDINKNWSNFTFVLPCVSVGNVGQLATDLLISTMPNCHKAGQLINPRIVQPMVGYDPYDKSSSQLCASLECRMKLFCVYFIQYFKISFNLKLFQFNCRCNGFRKFPYKDQRK